MLGILTVGKLVDPVVRILWNTVGSKLPSIRFMSKN